jgi:hypothetical protein
MVISTGCEDCERWYDRQRENVHRPDDQQKQKNKSGQPHFLEVTTLFLLDDLDDTDRTDNQLRNENDLL